jgi:metal-responsive CopG/Arc/MetJ family transcriptional regulator
MSENEKKVYQRKVRQEQQWIKFEMRLHVATNERLLKIADANGMNRTEAIRDAIREYIYRNEKREGV